MIVKRKNEKGKAHKKIKMKKNGSYDKKKRINRKKV